MVDLRHEHRPEILRQVVQLQEREIERLKARIRAQAERIGQLSGDPGELQRELIKLQELLGRREHALFGRSSEQRGGQVKEPQDRAPQKGHGPKAQPILPAVDKVWTLDAPDQKCTACGGDLSAWEGQFEESEEIDVVERRFVTLKHKRQKYRCKCGGCVDTAIGPEKLRPGNRYSIGFAVEVAAQKYLDHLPLERQVRMMRREGLNVDSQTLWDQTEALARPLRSIVERLLVYLRQKSCLGMDETHWLMLSAKAKAEENTRWFVWSLVGDDAVVHRIYDTRAHTAAKDMLGDYAGVLLTDGYAAYEKARREGGRFLGAHCWSHVRREFLEAEKTYGQQATAVLNLIDELFRIEREVPNTGPPEERLKLRQQLREEKSRPITKALEVWGIEIARSFLPESTIAKAAAYMAGLWPGLTRFLIDANVAVDNNATERALRGAVIGRKNHYGSKSRRGTEVAALFYSIIETCKLCGVDPKLYMRNSVLKTLRGETPPLPHEIVALPS